MLENIPYIDPHAAHCQRNVLSRGPHVPIVGLVRTQTSHPVNGVSVCACRACFHDWSCVGMLTYQEHNGILFSVDKVKAFLNLPWTHLMHIILLLNDSFYSTFSLDISIQLQTLLYSGCIKTSCSLVQFMIMLRSRSGSACLVHNQILSGQHLTPVTLGTVSPSQGVLAPSAVHTVTTPTLQLIVNTNIPQSLYPHPPHGLLNLKT